MRGTNDLSFSEQTLTAMKKMVGRIKKPTPKQPYAHSFHLQNSPALTGFSKALGSFMVQPPLPQQRCHPMTLDTNQEQKLREPSAEGPGMGRSPVSQHSLEQCTQKTVPNPPEPHLSLHGPVRYCSLLPCSAERSW